MTNSIRALLARLIDYAGMFPPASLPLAAALRNYAEYLNGAEAWMLGRLVCPAAQLGALAPHQFLFNENSPLNVSALGPKNPSATQFHADMAQTAEQIAAFQQAWGARGRAAVVEITLPTEMEHLPAHLDTILTEFSRASQPTAIFCEIPLDAEWATRLPAALDALAAQNRRAAQPLGVKLRTGGVTAQAFPSTAQVASALLGCRERNLALKCTAGLHHPLRRYDNGVQTVMHGSINVFAAGILARGCALDLAAVQAILADQDASHFYFDDSGLTWRGAPQPLYATTNQIIQIRETALLSFGSCSFDEPRADLRALGWL